MRYEPGAGCASAASCMATLEVATGLRIVLNAPAIHSGFKVATMNQSAKPMVTVCANKSQKRRIYIGKMKMIQRLVDRDALAHYLVQKLNVEQYRDYCPNGLQVEGRAEIGSIVSGG